MLHVDWQGNGQLITTLSEYILPRACIFISVILQIPRGATWCLVAYHGWFWRCLLLSRIPWVILAKQCQTPTKTNNGGNCCLGQLPCTKKSHIYSSYELSLLTSKMTALDGNVLEVWQSSHAPLWASDLLFIRILFLFRIWQIEHGNWTEDMPFCPQIVNEGMH